MKKIIKLSESQLRDVVSKIIMEQSAPMNSPDLKSPNLKSKFILSSKYFDVYKKTGGKLTQVSSNQMMDNLSDVDNTFYIWSNGRVMSVNNFDKTKKIMGNMVIISDSSYKFVWDDGNIFDSSTRKITKKVTPVKINTVNCANQLIDITKGKILKFGCKTQGVKELQTLLDFTTPTGYFGNITKQKVMDFQKKNKIKKVDGIVGPETYKALTTPKTPTDTSGLGVDDDIDQFNKQQTNEYSNRLTDLEEDEDIAMLDNLLKKD